MTRFSHLALTAVVLLSAPFAHANFFENSTRRDPSPTEPMTRALVRIKSAHHGYCGGFFVKNSQNEFFIASARHCWNYDYATPCRNGEITLETQVGAFKGRCTEVIAGDADHDAIVFRASFTALREEVLRKIEFATMSHVTPVLGTRLHLLGYPRDPARKMRATVTTGCWINDGIDAFTLYSAAETAKMNGLMSPAKTQQVEHVDEVETKVKYNCSVYGGNSGGPVAIEGTTTVIGMPAAYMPYSTRVLPKNSSSYFYSLKPFLHAHSRELTRAGITFE